MEQLNRLIKDASNEFECHNFQTSLSLYVRCIRKCEEEKFPSYILHNLKSSQAALRAILGEQEVALSILNNVLNQNKQHFLSLLRRSQIYKKQNKFKKALKDLDVLSMYAPDNMQVAALKLELKALLSKTDEHSSSSQSSDGEKIDEQEVLKFSNLKRIDRCSVSIMVPKGRQSRVTISGDKSFFYQSQNTEKNPKQSICYTPSLIKKKFIQIQDELQETGESQTSKVPPPVIIKSKPSRNKSILKNRNSLTYVQNNPSSNLISTEEGKKLIQKIQNIDGSYIGSQNGSQRNCSEKQVQFKKSIFKQEDPEDQDEDCFKLIKKKSKSRKSCLKRSSFSMNQQPQKNSNTRRGSKFENLTRNSIDGKMIKSDKKKQELLKEASKENQPTNENQSGDQSQVGSHYNIFGSKKLDINKQLRENLGLGSDEIMQIQRSQKPKTKTRGQSILKKTSILIKKDNKKKQPSVFFRQNNENELKPEKKAKKSVMFRSC